MNDKLITVDYEEFDQCKMGYELLKELMKWIASVQDSHLFPLLTEDARKTFNAIEGKVFRLAIDIFKGPDQMDQFHKDRKSNE